jgi:hypothetical protein
MHSTQQLTGKGKGNLEMVVKKRGCYCGKILSGDSEKGV